jgi:hypothetical protein
MARWIGPDYNEQYGIVLPGFDDPVKPRSMTDAAINLLISYNPELVVYFDMLQGNPVGNGVNADNVTFQIIELSPAFLNVIPNLSPLPANPAKVEIKVNGVRVKNGGISVNANGVFTVSENILGYSVDVGDTISAIYFS